MKQCSIIVFGDIGRSPRMVNHALAIADNTEYRINLYGYADNQPTQNYGPQSMVGESIQEIAKSIVFALCSNKSASIIDASLLHFVIQQKIGIHSHSKSTLSTCFACGMSYKVIIDFHNYGHTILALSLKNSLILRVATWYEHYFAQYADFALCVSQAMQKDLQQRWNIRATPVYDKANVNFNLINNTKDKHQLLSKLNFQWNWNSMDYNETLFTIKQQSEVVEKENRPALLISSTSWTKDEDFNILVQALQKYEDLSGKFNIYPLALEGGREYRKLYVVITGKGPMKEEFNQIFQKYNIIWNYVKVNLAWLDIDDYPKLLGCADLGICLHYSSSGLDLPMKVVDMFGAGTPVFAKQFPAIGELVEHKRNGMVFDTADDLYEYLTQAFKFESTMLQKLKQGVQDFRKETFDQEWRRKVLPYIRNLK